MKTREDAHSRQFARVQGEHCTLRRDVMEREREDDEETADTWCDLHSVSAWVGETNIAVGQFARGVASCMLLVMFIACSLRRQEIGLTYSWQELECSL